MTVETFLALLLSQRTKDLVSFWSEVKNSQKAQNPRKEPVLAGVWAAYDAK
jgi:hypothetical protein